MTYWVYEGEKGEAKVVVLRRSRKIKSEQGMLEWEVFDLGMSDFPRRRVQYSDDKLTSSEGTETELNDVEETEKDGSSRVEMDRSVQQQLIEY